MAQNLLARLGSEAQLLLVERENHTAFRGSNRLKNKGKTEPHDLAAMPAAASENTPRQTFGNDLANRRCSEWRAAGNGRMQAALTVRYEAPLRRGSRNGPEGSGNRPRNRQADGKGPSGLDPPPDGTDATAVTAMIAGSHEPPDCARQNGRERRLGLPGQLEPDGPDATSIAMQWHPRVRWYAG